MARTLRLLIPLLVLAAPAPVGAQAGALQTYRTRHYDLRTDIANPGEIEDIGRFVEGMYRTYHDVFRGDPVRQVSRPVVTVYASEADYRSRRGADDTSTRGFYERAGNELMSYRGTSLTDLFSVLSHEGFHQFATEYMQPPDCEALPSWYEEGLAEHFRSGGLTTAGRLRPQTLAYHYERVRRAIREGWVWTLDQVLDCDPSLLQADALRFEAFYAHVYIFVEYLIEERRSIVLHVYERKREGAENAIIMMEIFDGIDRERLYQGFMEFVARG